MKTFAFCILPFAFLLTSCLTVNRIQRNCDKFAQICTTPVSIVTEYRDTTFYIKDTVYYRLPPDTVTITDTVQIIDNFCQLKTVYKRFGLINVSAGVASNILRVNAWLTDSTLLIPHLDTVYIRDAIQNTTTTQTVTVEKRHIPGFYKFTFWVFIIAVSLLFVYLWWIRFFKGLTGKFPLL